MKPTDFALHLNKYFVGYLTNERNLSKNTISSYRDTFSQFLRYCKEHENLPPEKLTISVLNPTLINGFLQFLESENKSISTRNQRLAALRAFFRYIQYAAPEHMITMQQLLMIKNKKNQKSAVNYLSIEGITRMLEQPSSNTRNGYRDMLLLTVLYDSGARVSELIEIKVGDVRTEAPATILLCGKGGKSRIVPLSANTASLLRNYFEKERLNVPQNIQRLLFPNRSSQKLTRSGVLYIVTKYGDMARAKSPELIPNVLTPHCFRHSKAMHLLQSGVNLVYIRDFLGHENLATTEIYARSDSLAKRKAIENAYSPKLNDTNFKASWLDDHDLMSWLKNLM